MGTPKLPLIFTPEQKHSAQQVLQRNLERPENNPSYISAWSLLLGIVPPSSCLMQDDIMDILHFSYLEEERHREKDETLRSS